MKMHKRSGILLIAAGTALLIAALSLFIYNRYEDMQAGNADRDIIYEIRTEIEKRDTKNARQPKTAADPETAEHGNKELTVVYIGNYGYIGYLSVPILELELPIMSEWDYKRMKIAPCRQFGSSKTDDLVIAGHNSKRHFGRFSKLKTGDTVYFTDMDGTVNTYTVAKTDTLKPTEVESVRNSGYDLVLYTCTYSGKSRITLFCNRNPP